MAFDPNFTAQPILGVPSDLLFTDTSTGSDTDILSRVIYLAKIDGSYLVPEDTLTDYIEWDLDDPTLTVDVLNKDYALVVTVTWLGLDSEVLYSKVYLLGFTAYNETFDYYLTQMLAANPSLINDNNFWDNKSTLRTYIDSGNQALVLASDQGNAQICYDEATKLRVGSQYYYNANA